MIVRINKRKRKTKPFIYGTNKILQDMILRQIMFPEIKSQGKVFLLAQFRIFWHKKMKFMKMINEQFWGEECNKCIAQYFVYRKIVHYSMVSYHLHANGILFIERKNKNKNKNEHCANKSMIFLGSRILELTTLFISLTKNWGEHK